jgi:hypoxanthine phosphoribosyltransferase
LKAPRPLFDVTQVQERIRQLGEEISPHYEGRRPVLLGLLRGCVPFLSSLIQHLDFPFDLEFAQGSSYENATAPAHAPVLRFPGSPAWSGRDVLVVDDILDTGATYAALVEDLHTKEVASIRLCVLLDKPARRQASVAPDWRGFEIPDLFAVGFGMDHAGDYRGLPWIGVLD